jgi:membrane-associated HD superfamily phosphohydrolase
MKARERRQHFHEGDELFLQKCHKTAMQKRRSCRRKFYDELDLSDLAVKRRPVYSSDDHVSDRDGYQENSDKTPEHSVRKKYKKRRPMTKEAFNQNSKFLRPLKTEG